VHLHILALKVYLATTGGGVGAPPLVVQFLTEFLPIGPFWPKPRAIFAKITGIPVSHWGYPTDPYLVIIVTALLHLSHFVTAQATLRRVQGSVLRMP
jgi:hypothetical protein